MATLANLVTNLTGDSSKLVKAANRGTESLKRFGKAGLRAGKTGALAGGALGAAAIGGIALLVNRSRQSIDTTGKLSTQLGVSAGATRTLQIQASEAGIKMETLRRGVRNATRNLEAFSRGDATAKVSEVMESLGITAEQAAANLQSPIEAFRFLAERITATNDPAREITEITTLLGDRMLEARPILEGFGKNFTRTGQFIRQFSSLTDQNVRDVEAMNDSLGRSSEAIKLVGEGFTASLAPAITAASEGLQKWFAAVIQANGGIGQLSATLAGKLIGAFKKIAAILEPFILLFQFLGKIANVVVTGIGRAVAAGTLAAGGDFSGATGALRGDFDSKTQENQLRNLDLQTDLLKKVVNELESGLTATAG